MGGYPMTNREKSEIVNKAIGAAVMWLGVGLLGALIVGAAIRGITMWVFFKKVLIPAGMIFLGAAENV